MSDSTTQRARPFQKACPGLKREVFPRLAAVHEAAREAIKDSAK